MKKLVAIAGALLVLAAVVAVAQPPDEPGGRPDGPPGGPRRGRPDGPQGRRPDGPPPPDPLMKLFDTDCDGEISSDEMDAASATLRKLDSNEDGVLTREELPRPPRPGDERRGRGRFGDGPPGGGPQGGAPPRDGRRGDGSPGDQGRPRGPRRPPDDDVSIDPATRPPARSFSAVAMKPIRVTADGPVALIAAALGVESQVFRDAFSGVHPARGRGPTDAEARANKQVLMAALGQVRRHQRPAR